MIVNGLLLSLAYNINLSGHNVPEMQFQKDLGHSSKFLENLPEFESTVDTRYVELFGP